MMERPTVFCESEIGAPQRPWNTVDRQGHVDDNVDQVGKTHVGRTFTNPRKGQTNKPQARSTDSGGQRVVRRRARA